MQHRPVSYLHHLLLISLASLSLISCSGDDGNPGAPGTDGAPGTPGAPAVITTSDASDGLDVVITDVDIGPPTVVSFTMTSDSVPYTGFQASQGRFMIVQLATNTSGEADSWQSYINREETPTPGVGTGTTPQIQATSENSGTLVDNGDGTYTYSFATDITAVTTPTPVTYDDSLTHRVGIEIRGGLPAVNAQYDFQPDTGATTGINSRTIVKLDSCNSCHGELALHGGGRIDTENCVLCHNPGTIDANSGNTVDFPVMIHKIHRGSDLPSVVAGTDYIIYGHRDSAHNYSEVVYPQDIRNCTNCHDPSDTDTPDAGNITMYPSIEGCVSCHDGMTIDVSGGLAHAGGTYNNGDCTVCHAAGQQAGDILEDHTIDSKVAAGSFEYNIVAVRNTAPGQIPEIDFSITDPTNGNAFYNILTAPEFGGNTEGAARLAVIIGWNTTDYSNTDSGTAPGKTVSINPLATATTTDNEVFTVISPVAIPASETGSGAVSIEGHPGADPDGDGTYDTEAPVTGVVEYFAITDAAPVERREVVELAKCQVCHGVNDGLALHGGNRTDSIEQCVMCHNSNATDLAQRPTDADATVNQVNAAATGGAEEETIEFKHMIHAIHGAEVRENDFLVYGFFNSTHDYSHAEYPRSAADCDACHTSDGFELPLPSGVLGTTVRTQATVNTSSNFGTQSFWPDLATAQDPTDDFKISPESSACSSCHDSAMAQAHMEHNGGLFLNLQSVIDGEIETCSICHGPGRDADVATVHGID